MSVEQSGSGSGARTPVLVVEDEFLIALDIEDILTRHGCRVIGPAPSVAAALDLLEREQPAAALLDVNLRGERVTPVAQALERRNIPFVLATAYDRDDLELPLLQNAPRVPKPISERRLLRALRAAFDGATGGEGRVKQPASATDPQPCRPDGLAFDEQR